MKNFLRQYWQLERPIHFFILAILCFNLLDAALFLILNIFLSKSGFSDPDIAGFLSFRFLAVLLCAIPLGLLIQKRSLRPFFFVIIVLFYSSVWLLLWAIEWGNIWLIDGCFALLGISIGSRHIMTLPYILRNVKESQHTAVISLNFATWSLGYMLAGISIFLMRKWNPVYFDEPTILRILSVLGIIALLALTQMKQKEHIPAHNRKRYDLSHFDWGRILKAATPTLMIAIGAGLTIPFINLFFYHRFGIDSELFALMGTTTAVLIFGAALSIPLIKNKWGYESITVSQSLSVLALIVLASTDFMTGWVFAIYLAIFCFVVRQPLMNLANPMTSEMTMYYVGEKNREMMSAISSSIWSGSWFFSSLMFKILRESGLNYGSIFLITAAMYIFGIALYYLLIKEYQQMTKSPENNEL